MRDPDKPLLPPVLWVAIFLGMMWGAMRLFPETRFDFPGRTVVPFVFYAIGIGFGVAGIAGFAKHKTTVNPHDLGKSSRLVTTGVYGITRNPMYVGMALIVLGFGIGTGSLIALSLAPVFVIAMTKFQIRPEEAAMRRLFGENFDTYAARVPRWLLV